MSDTETIDRNNIERKKEAYRTLLDQIARRERPTSPKLAEILRRRQEAIERQPRLSDEDLNMRAGY